MIPLRPSSTLDWPTLATAVWLGAALACGNRENTEANRPVAARTANPAARDCLGPDSIVDIEAGRVGALPLDLSLDSLRARCTNIRDTTANGDERIDTAIVIARPGLRVVGTLAAIDAGDGIEPVHLTGASKVEHWIVLGSAGRLPKNVPLTATWAALVRAYGPVAGRGGDNGDVFLRFCPMPGFVFSMSVPFEALIDTLHPAAAESTRLASPILAVYVPERAQTTDAPKCP